jgi:hypothetical protein
MKTHPFYPSRATQLLYFSAMAWACSPAMAQTGASTADAASRYQRERATCLDGQSAQDRTTCLREATAAQSQRRKGAAAEDSSSYERNALQRCDTLQGDERKACVARIQGQGSTSGSVSGGGVLRELVVTEPDKSGVQRPASGTAASPSK